MSQVATVTIENIDIEGKAIAKIDGKVVFVAGALPGEIVEIEIYKQKTNFALARLTNILCPSPNRVKPKCPHFGTCGGCSMQHLQHSMQLQYKQQFLIDTIKHIGKVSSIDILPPLNAPSPWYYRHRARLSARYVVKKGAALVGFRERASSYVADMGQCHILPQHISLLIPHLRQLLASLSIRDSIPQIELAVGHEVSVLVFRVMRELSVEDQIKLKEFIDAYSTAKNPLQLWLQPRGIDSCYQFYPQQMLPLTYLLSDYAITMPYYPTEFTQVNPVLNQKMVALALKLLNLQYHEVVFDFFCGIGNFTLPIASQVHKVVGFEGNSQLITRANANAKYNNLHSKVSYKEINLFKIDSDALSNLGKADKWLLDPPRDGAIELVKAINSTIKPKVIVYVSCNPATLARDISVLVNVHGYRLIKVGVIDMFPHTSHVESIALLSQSEI